MPIRERQYPMKFVPRGLVDALDSTEKFMGACIEMSNLVFDQLNPEIVVSRPGVVEETDFTGFTTPGVVSVFITIGNVVYGMVESGLNAGKDEPFAYDLDAASFISISGITNGNSPTTQATSGPWEPPTMAVVGTLIYVTHPGFPGATEKFGVLDITTPSAPTWTATDTTTNALSARPQAVANFNNRAYFAVGNHLEYTDVLSIVRTNSSQVLTLGSPTDITALSGLPVQTTSSGVVQALLAFKAFEIWQVTGDAASSNLAQNYLQLTLGCPAPRSVVPTPRGVYFVNPSGPYIVDTVGAVRPLVNSQRDEVPDIVAPFQNCTEFTRVAAGYCGSIYRVCLDTVISGETGRNDYWFDELRRRWNGPHSFTYDCAGQAGKEFVLCSNVDDAKLFTSQARPDVGSVYTDDGVATTGGLTTSTFPKPGHMTQKQVVESTIELSSAGAATSYAITAVDDGGDTLSSVSISVAAAGAVWGGFVWGDGTFYTSSTNRPRVYTVPWTRPLVFKKMGLQITAPANAALAIGAFFARYQDLGYTNWNSDQGTPS